jgi:chromosome condensin MukBEF MukE localization factor
MREDQRFAIGVGNKVRPGFDRCESSGRLLSRDDVTEIVRVSDARQDLDEFFAFEP